MISNVPSIVILCRDTGDDPLSRLRVLYKDAGFQRVLTVAIGQWSQSSLTRLKQSPGLDYLGQLPDEQSPLFSLLRKVMSNWFAIVSADEYLVLPHVKVAETVACLSAMGLTQLRAVSIPLASSRQRLVMFHSSAGSLIDQPASGLYEQGMVGLERGPIQAALVRLDSVSGQDCMAIYQANKLHGAVIEPTRHEVQHFPQSLGGRGKLNLTRRRRGRRRGKAAMRPSVLDRGASANAVGRIGLVSFELMRATKCGGIGTAMSALAELLSRAGNQVEVIFCPFRGSREIDPELVSSWADAGVDVSYFPRSWEGSPYPDHEEYSYRLAKFIDGRGQFDVLHFHDSAGYAALPLLMRESGLAFAGTRMAVTAHGPSRWHRVANSLPWNRDEALQHHFEDISFRLADTLISPSEYMSKWLSDNHRTSKGSIVLPNALPVASRLFARSPAGGRAWFKRLVFFGRVEIRKGIEVFIEAIQEAINLGLADVEVLILGTLGEGITRSWFHQRTRNWPLPVVIEDDKGHAAALDLLRDGASLVIIPSQTDNSPYTVYECLEGGIPLLASTTGGIPELIAPDDRDRMLFAPGDIHGLAQLIMSSVENGLSPARLSFAIEEVDSKLLSLHADLVKRARQVTNPVEAAPAQIAELQFVSPYSQNEGVPSGSQVVDLVRVSVSRNTTGGMTAEVNTGVISLGSGLKAAIGLEKLVLTLQCSVLLVTPEQARVDTDGLAAGLRLLETTGSDAVCFSCSVDRDNGTDTAIQIATAGPPELSPFKNTFGCGPFLIRRDCFAQLVPKLGSLWQVAELPWLILNRLMAEGGTVFGMPEPLSRIHEAELPPGIAAPALNLSNTLMVPWSRAEHVVAQGFLRMTASMLRGDDLAGLTSGLRRNARGDDKGPVWPRPYPVGTSGIAAGTAGPLPARPPALAGRMSHAVRSREALPPPAHAGALPQEEGRAPKPADALRRRPSAADSLVLQLMERSSRNPAEEWEERRTTARVSAMTADSVSSWGGPPLISVLVCTHNRPDKLALLLDSLKPQIASSATRELIVYNDGTHDESYGHLERACSGWLQYVAGTECLGVARARNAAARRARGHYLVYVDDDCVAPRWWLDWLESRLIAAPRVDVLAGTTLPLASGRKNLNAEVQSIFDLVPKPFIHRDDTVIFVTANLAVSRELFESMSGFSCPAGFNGAGEDTDFALRCAAAGARVEMDPSWHVFHEVGERLVHRMRRHFSYGLANSWMYEQAHAREYVEAVFKDSNEQTLSRRFHADWLAALTTARKHGYKGMKAHMIAANRALSAVSFVLGCRAAHKQVTSRRMGRNSAPATTRS